MKIQITERGAHAPGKKEPLKVGDVFKIEGDKVPAFLVGKCVVLGKEIPAKSEAVSKGKEPVKNELSEEDTARQARLMEVCGELSEDDFTRDGPPKLDAVNQKLKDGEKAFSGAERDKLWVSA